MQSEQKVGRSDPPSFLFEPLRTSVLDSLAGPSGLSTKLLSVIAPVGYGKTVLMSLLLADLRRAGKQCIWFALDERDTTVDSLIAALKALLDSRVANLHPTQALFSGNEPLERRIDSLLALLNHSALPLTIFIDNLHYCTDPDFGRLLDQLCFSSKPSIQFVLSGTRELPFNTPRAVLEGLLRQVGPVDLSFGVAAVARMLGTELCERIGDAGVAKVAQQTEGWPAATRMVQIILAGSDQPQAALASFTGTDEGLAQLLNRQVLSGFEPRAREFLLAISPLRSFCAELCRHASGSAKASAYLADLLQRNVFVIPLDRNGNWYRLHGLFRDYLIREAEHALPESRRHKVLGRAALWCEKNGYWREAVDYALASGSSITACQILERIAASFVRDRGDIQQYVGWIETLHERGVEAGPEAEFWFVWALSFCRRYDYARQHSTRLLQRLKSQRRNSAALQRRIAILRISIDSLTDHLFDAHAGASAWLAGRDGDDDPFNVTAAHCIESDFHSSHFRFVEALSAIQCARESAFQTRSVYVDGWVSAYAAFAPIYQGDYAVAYPQLIAALDATRRGLSERGGIGGTLAMIAAKCAAEMGLDKEARELLKSGLPSSRTHGFVEATALGLEAAVLLWEGRDDDTISLASLRDIASAYPPRLSQMLSCYLIRRCLSLGRMQEARDEAARLGLASASWAKQGPLAENARIPQMRDLYVAAELELLIAEGRQKTAEALITTELSAAQELGRPARQVELLLLRIRMAARSQRGGGVISRSLAQAIRLAAPRRIVRPFLRHADTLAAVMSEGKLSDLGFAAQDEQRFFLDLCARGSWAAPSRLSPLAHLLPEPRVLGKLTPRELELLRLLDAGLSNQQIANHVDVSLTTIKWHLQNLYGKLNVSTRSAALARARTVSLLQA